MNIWGSLSRPYPLLISDPDCVVQTAPAASIKFRQKELAGVETGKVKKRKKKQILPIQKECFC
jgi:hypothetical protein